MLIASLLPDLALGVSGSSRAGVAALMVMHLGVAAVALTCYARFLPLPTGRTSALSPVRPPVDGAAQRF